ncbi:MAG: carotenoid biosynthesis protein [Gemmatimonadetes bacterium]|nr:carotenoid biosynthesis protein [Gemmatimonadota bacterium]
MTPRVESTEAEPRLLEWGGLVVLVSFTASAVLGYWTFGLHPNLIPDNDFARNFFGLSFKLFARGHIVVAGVVLAIKLYRHSDLRWLAGLGAVAFLSFLAEHIGTGYGFPFGGYEYTGLLGYKLGGRVPFLIPISWFLMALPAWILASMIFPTRRATVPRLIMGAYLLTAWDLALDPAMSFLTPYWVWENPGPFYGMPWINLAGWMGTGLILMGALEILKVRSWTAKLDVRWVLAYYLVVLLMPVGMLAASGIWVPILATFVALVLPIGWVVSSMYYKRPAKQLKLVGGKLG